MRSKTKIVATIGPSSERREVIAAMIREGMSVARMNFSHGTLSEKIRHIRTVREVSGELGITVGLMSDLQGPEVRTHMGRKELKVNEGDVVTVSGKEGYGEIKVKPSSVLAEIQEGDELYIDGGKIVLLVKEKEEGLLKCEVIHGGIIKDRRSVHSSRTFNLRGLTEEDKEAIKVSISEGVDFIALSFVKSPEDVAEAKEFMKSLTDEPPEVIAKIETEEAVRNIRGILEESYGIMVARGDLGVDMPLQEIPNVQKKLIRLANEYAKPVITATEMLESMTSNPVPTRAEVTDVFNAILDGSDAVMLSAETAIGKYPVLSVRWMRLIALEAEKSLKARLDYPIDRVDSFIGKAAVEASELLKAPLIACFTYSGFTARNVVRHRPRARILALVSRERTKRILTISWGVESLEVGEDEEEAIQQAMDHGIKEGLLKAGDKMVLTMGYPHGKAKTNTLRIVEVKS